MSKVFRELHFDGKNRLVSLEDLMEENKELVTKCNQLEKEKMLTQDTIEEMLLKQNELLREIEQLSYRLGIATKTLEEIKSNCSLKDDFSDHKEMAFSALKQIQEVK